MKIENKKPPEDNNHQKSLVEQLDLLNSRVDSLNTTVLVLSKELMELRELYKKTNPTL